MSMLCIKTTAIVIKHSTSPLATDFGYFKTKKNLHINVGT